MSVFKNLPAIAYEGPKSRNPLSFKHYDPNAVIGGKTMRETLRFSMAYWHTLCGSGSDMFGAGTYGRDYGTGGALDQAKRKADAGFEFMKKLGLDWFCFHDHDLIEEADTLAESHKRLDAIADYLEPLIKANGTRVLWGTANLFSHPRFMTGAATSHSADIFAYAAAKVKKALEITARLGGKSYTFWGGREGYETLLNTDMGLEIDNLARFFKMAIEYGRKIGISGDFYIEPKPKEPTKHQYDFDSATALHFLQKYGLDKDVKLNIEANHATLAGHTFQHELCVARVNGALGSVDANTGDLLLGWDTDQFPTNVYDTTLCMLEVLAMGGFKTGGLNFDAKARRASVRIEDLAGAHIAGMDAFALGLKMAQKIIEDGRLGAFVSDRYATYKTGIGADIVAGTATLESLEAYALRNGEPMPEPGRQEYLESVMNDLMFA
jgi:xylose isomerase